MLKALNSCQKSNKLPNLVTLIASDLLRLILHKYSVISEEGSRERERAVPIQFQWDRIWTFSKFNSYQNFLHQICFTSLYIHFYFYTTFKFKFVFRIELDLFNNYKTDEGVNQANRMKRWQLYSIQNLILIIIILRYTQFKGIVSQDWGELQMIPVDS